MALAVILLGLLIWGIQQPVAWIVVSFLAIGSGIGGAVYGEGGTHTNRHESN